MVYTENGTGIEHEGISFAVGMNVLGNGESEYQGLCGIITEIRTDPDKDTDNETPDIYCSFEAPDDPAIVKELEKIFSGLYGQPKSIDEIALDLVIMAPDMLIPDQN